MIGAGHRLDEPLLGIGHGNAQLAALVAQQPLAGEHRIKVEADDIRRHAFALQLVQLRIVVQMRAQPAMQRVALPHPAGDEVKAEEYDVAPVFRFLGKRGIAGLVKVGRIDVIGYDVAVDAAQRRHGGLDARRHRHEHAQEPLPAALMRWPPAKPPAIPCGDARLVQRRIPVDASPKALRQPCCIFRDMRRIVGIEEGTFHPARQAIVNEIDLRCDAEIEQPFEWLIGMLPLPAIAFRLDAVPRHAIARGGYAQARHQPKVMAPAIIVAGEFIFIERAAGHRMGRRDEGVLDARRPPEGIGPRELGKIAAPGQRALAHRS